MNIQDIWDRIEEIKKEQKDIRAVYRDMLSATGDRETLLEELETLKARKKQMEADVAGQMEQKMQRMDFLKHELAEQRQLLADMALSNLMKGEPVEVVGPNDTAYEPLFAVRFRKRQ